MKELIRLIQFGAPIIQNHYKTLCESAKISFDDFQLKLIDDTGYSYDELKEFWISGEEVKLSENQINDLEIVYVPKYLIVHFDLSEKTVLGIANTDYECLTDTLNFYEEIN